MNQKKFPSLHWVLIGSLILFSQYSIGQLKIDSILSRQLAGKKKLADIMNAVNSFYAFKDFQHNRGYFSQFKKWKRWEWYMARHLNGDGEIINDARLIQQAITYEENSMPRQTLAPLSGSGNWTPLGPELVNWWPPVGGSIGIGRVDRIAFHPSNPFVIYAGAPAGGLWRTDDGGNTWYPLNSYWPSLGISGIVVSWNDPNTLYVLTGDGDSNNGGYVQSFGYIRNSIGVLKSTDGGATWFPCGNLPITGNYVGYNLVQSPTNANILLAATSSGIYRTTDGGLTWAAILFGGVVYDVAFRPGDGNTAYCASIASFFRSTDGGANFSSAGINFSPAFPASGRVKIATSAANNNLVMLLAGGSPTTASYNGLWRSPDQGKNFTRIHNTPNVLIKSAEGRDSSADQSVYDLAMSIRSDNTNEIVVGGLCVWHSADGGNSFPNSTLYFGNSTLPANHIHPDVHELAFNPLNNILYVGTDGGIARSFDNGITWTNISNNLQITQYYHMAGFAGNASILAGGAQDNGTHARDLGSTFLYVNGGDGYDVAYDQSNSNILYSVANNTLARLNFSTNSAVNITPGGVAGFYPSIAVHPTNSNIIYAGYVEGIFRSNNQGNNWTQTGLSGSNGGNSGAGGLAVSAQFPDRVYAATNNTLWRSNDLGANWFTISGNPGWPTNPNLTITDVKTRNNNANEVWVTFGGSVAGVKVFYSGDAGSNWTNLSGSLPNIPINCVYYTTDGDAYIGTDIGVYFMDFTWNDWIPFRNNLPRVPVTEIIVNEGAGLISAATFGRGIWQSDLHQHCVPDIVLGSGLYQGYQFYQASNSITSTGFTPTNPGNEIFLRAGSRITLSPGFGVLNGSYMKSIIGPCGESIPFQFSTQALSKKDLMKW